MRFFKVLKIINGIKTNFFEPYSKLKLKYYFQFCKVKI